MYLFQVFPNSKSPLFVSQLHIQPFDPFNALFCALFQQFREIGDQRFHARPWAGIDGLKSRLELPKTTQGDPGSLTKEELQSRGIQRLPQSLDEALLKLEQSERLQTWMGDELHNAYLVHKRSELSLLDGLDPDEQVRRYVECY